MDRAIPLTGGRITKGAGRIGETVRRPGSVKSAFLAESLHLLERQGFEGAPRYLGQDDEGRVLADAFGLAGRQRAGVVEATLERQVRNVRFSTEAVVDVTDQQRAERIAWSRREHAFTAANREVFERALG